jgi:L-ascorbate metabolism protein UlaG (beta-lactamase superfamily)
MLPVHWGLFDLSLHGWTEPIERLLASAGGEASVVVPRPGQSFEPARPPVLERWWPQLPWQTAQEHPVVSSMVD